MTNTTENLTSERADLLETLQKHRELFRFTVQGLDDEQARTRSTISELTLGGLVKHVAATEKHWAQFILDGPAPSPDIDWANVDWSNPPPEVAAYADGFRMLEGETLVDLDQRQPLPLPEAPWFAPGATWSARRDVITIVVTGPRS